MIQNTYVFDTNVYGEVLIEPDSLGLIRRIERDKSLYIYGLDVIERELQDVPTDKKIKGDMFRELVLATYKSLVDEELVLSPLAKYLAAEYYKKYGEMRKSGKYYKVIRSKELKYREADLKVDFQIIAAASLEGVDIVVSADKRTMLSKLAVETYGAVNKKNGLATPKLVDYFEFRKRYTE